jgi:uncharacterized protein YydD (DUF2326 family)
MIYSISCDKPSFKTIKFRPGFNVILAKRSEKASTKDSRNGLGKSTIVEIIRFCLGLSPGDTLSNPILQDWTFSLDLEIRKKRYSISRNISSDNKVAIRGDISDWPVETYKEEKTGEKIISTEDLLKALGNLIFDLLPEDPEFKYRPKFGSLISYFVRKNGHMGGFLNPFQQHKEQRPWDQQIASSFLLGLGWEFASKLQVLKDREKVLYQIRSEAKSGMLSDLMGDIGVLEARKIILEKQSKDEDTHLHDFRVHPQYENLEREADRLTRQIHADIDKKVEEGRILKLYEDSLLEEVDADPEKIKKVYVEAGLLFPTNVTNKINEVLAFHRNVVSNRKQFLESEITRLRRSIITSQESIIRFTSERAAIMQLLSETGTLREYTLLEGAHQKTISELEDVKRRIENLNRFENGRNALEIDKQLLHQQAVSDLNERRFQKELAIITFNDYLKSIIDLRGNLSIVFTETGYKFDIIIERSPSSGIGNLKIFCYDLTLAKIWSRKPESSVFLVHDSVVFDGVDERQKAHALELAKSESEKEGFQYICSLNSDSVPRDEFGPEFLLDKYVVQEFTDAEENGGLLGIRF